MGTSSDRFCSVALYEDHPHACGDKLYLQIVWRHLTGSSPRVWGQVILDTALASICRIIPTRVGTRTVTNVMICVVEDHPHACGDKYWVDTRNTAIVGSSPRVWGQEKDVTWGMAKSRIIPTRVGTSLKENAAPNAWRHHPHACGDKA